AYHNVNLNPDRAAGLEESKRFLDAYYGPGFTPGMVEAWTAAGTPAQCVEHLRGLLAEGPKSVTLRITSWQQRDQFERLVGAVRPRPLPLDSRRAASTRASIIQRTTASVSRSVALQISLRMIIGSMP